MNSKITERTLLPIVRKNPFQKAYTLCFGKSDSATVVDLSDCIAKSKSATVVDLADCIGKSNSATLVDYLDRESSALGIVLLHILINEEKKLIFLGYSEDKDQTRQSLRTLRYVSEYHGLRPKYNRHYSFEKWDQEIQDAIFELSDIFPLIYYCGKISIAFPKKTEDIPFYKIDYNDRIAESKVLVKKVFSEEVTFV